jgi:eukaryotic-like serine/threonine-protein kinase
MKIVARKSRGEGPTSSVPPTIAAASLRMSERRTGGFVVPERCRVGGPCRDEGHEATAILAEENKLRRKARARVGVVLGGKYRLDRVLGVGGMGCVYAATHLRNGDRVAVKILHRELSLDSGLRARFLVEGSAANSVEHSGTVRVLDDDIAEDGSLYLVMDLLDGETLHSRWQRSGQRLGAREVAALMCEVLSVLGAAHARGIVHRDLKPENLFITRDGEVKVLDFGLARPREGSPTQTKTGTVFGTPAFMAPEQALGRTSEVDALSDLWAVGATAFLLLTGRLVHQSGTSAGMVALSATEPAPAIASVVHDIPPILGKIVDRALAFDKAARWPTAQAMRAALLDAGRIAWPSDGPDAVEYEDEERTAPAPPSRMTPETDLAPSMPEELEAPTLPGAPGVELQTLPERDWRAFPFLSLAVCGVGVGIAIAVILALPAASRRHAPDASEPSAMSLQARGGAVTASSAWIANAPAPGHSPIAPSTIPAIVADPER